MEFLGFRSCTERGERREREEDDGLKKINRKSLDELVNIGYLNINHLIVLLWSLSRINNRGCKI